MKKEKPPILVIFCMFLLLLLIVIPPVVRKYIPKEEVKINNTKSITLLKCNKTFSDNLHTATSTSKYIDNVLKTNKIIFKSNINENNIGTTNDNNLENNDSTITNNTTSINTNEHTYDEEYQNLINMKNANVVTNDNVTTIIIDKKIADANRGSDGIMYYFQPLENQKGFYEYMGYTCDVIEG